MESNVSQLTFPILTPETPLAFLPPDIGSQIEATRYLYIASLSAFIWDVLSTMDKDYALVTRFSLTFPTVVYFTSRIMALAHITTSTIFLGGVVKVALGVVSVFKCSLIVAPVGSCQALQVALGWCWAIATPTTSLLFFFRIRAVFSQQKPIVAFFGALWLATLGGSITVPFSISGGHIGPTNRCINTAVKPLSSAGIVVNTCNDTLVFIAISWHVISRTSADTKIRSFLGGRGLPYISRELLKGGQQYYLITVGGNILTMAMILSPSSRIPPAIKAMFTVPNMALENSMACRVFRNIILRRMTENEQKSSNNNLPSGADFPVFALRTFGGTEMSGPVDNGKAVGHDVRDLMGRNNQEQAQAGTFARSEDDYV